MVSMSSDRSETSFVTDADTMGEGGAATDAGDSTESTAGTPACVPQSRVCEGNQLLRCAGDGSGYMLDEECVGPCDVERAQCPTCTPEAVRCNGAILERCSADGQLFELVSQCIEATLCDETMATCFACPIAGSPVCVGNETHTCNAERLATTLVESCGSLGCNPATAECNRCNPVASQCSATEYCAASSCSETGVCTPRPDDSSPVLSLACGCDGVTYWNAQYAQWLGVTTGENGLCPAANARRCDPDTGVGCSAGGEYCNAQWGRGGIGCGTTNAGTPTWSQCFNKPVDFSCPAEPDDNGAQFCAGGCTNDCVAYSSFQTRSAENCGA